MSTKVILKSKNGDLISKDEAALAKKCVSQLESGQAELNSEEIAPGVFLWAPLSSDRHSKENRGVTDFSVIYARISKEVVEIFAMGGEYQARSAAGRRLGKSLWKDIKD